MNRKNIEKRMTVLRKRYEQTDKLIRRSRKQQLKRAEEFTRLEMELKE